MSGDPEASSGEPKHRRRHHRSRRHHRHKQAKVAMRMGYFAAGCLLAALAVVLNLHDASIRRPDTDDAPGDPPTFFLLLAVVAAVMAGFCLIRLVLLMRKSGER